MLLADMGADVIKIEDPDGDAIRRIGAGRNGLSWYFASFNRNKRSVTLDLRSAADYLVRTHVCALACGVERLAWYQFQDGVWHSRRPDPTDLEYSFGLVYTDLTPKPAFVAYAERLQARPAYKEGKAIDNKLIEEMRK